MFVYRISKTKQRARDLSGTGAYRIGGRWNSKGTYMLYTSENSSLAYLEILVHMDESELPPKLFITEIKIYPEARIFTLPDSEYPGKWLQLGNPENKIMGDKWMSAGEFLAIKVRSAINQAEFNYLLNPHYPAFRDQVQITSVRLLEVDKRLK
jgi:RES domain-containing protein